MRVKMTFAVLALAALVGALPATAAAGGSRVIHVEPGESIQAAIDKAKPGTTIKLEEGKYEQSVNISKSDIAIVGEGRKQTEIAVPAASALPQGAGCVEEHEGQTAVSGICVFPEAEGQCENSPRITGPDAPPVVRAVDDVEISKLSVTGYTGDGVIYFCAEDPEVTRVLARGAEGSAYALAAFASEDVEFTRNLVVNGAEAGIYIGDSPDADAKVWRNVAWNNGFGIFLRDAAHGKAADNKTFGNCLGILVLNTDESDRPPEFQSPPIDAKDWQLEDNHVTANNRACPGGDEGGPISGIGIAIVSGIGNRVIDNGVFGNDSTAASDGHAGIVVLSEGALLARDNTVASNTAFGNTTDIVWDEQGTGNRFFRNDCLTSQPDGLCEDPDESGDGEHGDDDGHDGRDHKGDKRGDDKRKHAKSKKHRKHKHKKSKKHGRDDD